MKVIENSEPSRLDLLTLFELTKSAHELSIKLGLIGVSKKLHEAKTIASESATIETYLQKKQHQHETFPIRK